MHLLGNVAARSRASLLIKDLQIVGYNKVIYSPGLLRRACRLDAPRLYTLSRRDTPFNLLVTVHMFCTDFAQNDITDVLDLTFTAETDFFGRKELVELVPGGW
jgi:hypothetical protein